MAKFIKIEEDLGNGNKHVTYIKYDNVTKIRERGNVTDVYFVGTPMNFTTFNIPISDFIDLVNSAK